jgi:hypothetical protein
VATDDLLLATDAGELVNGMMSRDLRSGNSLGHSRQALYASAEFIYMFNTRLLVLISFRREFVSGNHLISFSEVEGNDPLPCKAAAVNHR